MPGRSIAGKKPAAHGVYDTDTATIGGSLMTPNAKLQQLIRPRSLAMLVAAVMGVATAVLVGVAVAKTFTLQVAKNAKVTNQTGSTKRENIAVTPRGFAVYELSGDSKHHPKCTKSNGCFTFWPPVTVKSAKTLSKPAGVSGRLGVWRRNGFLQLTLAGHPLYRFEQDSRRDVATGEGIHGFGGTWHVVKAAGMPVSTPTTTTSTSTTTTTTTPTTTTTTTPPPPCVYPPCY
jgi:predicted lipoprotein with Yx(FWY)xxD motif